MAVGTKVSYYILEKLTRYMCIVWLKLMKIVFNERNLTTHEICSIGTMNTIEFIRIFTQYTLILPHKRPLSKTISGQLSFSVILDFI